MAKNGVNLPHSNPEKKKEKKKLGRAVQRKPVSQLSGRDVVCPNVSTVTCVRFKVLSGGAGREERFQKAGKSQPGC